MPCVTQTKSNRAAIYLRSSQDRSDVSIDMQRRELHQYCADRGLTIVQEYTDVVASAKDEHRPGFQAIWRDLQSSSRAWDVLVMTDTSRLSRNIYVAQVFKHECKKRDVTLQYSKVPDLDETTGVVINAVLEAMDQMHSTMCREKGLAGMAENIHQGYRAGGPAPRGYRLEYVGTGAIRDGKEVMKSYLVPNEEAPLVQRYLKGRAAGRSRPAMIRELGLTDLPGSLFYLERNAQTYAGHTQWFKTRKNSEPDSGCRYKTIRRPPEEWHIQRNTHEPLITQKEADALLADIERNRNRAMQRASAYKGAKYLLTGLLAAPDGRVYQGCNRVYEKTLKNGTVRHYDQVSYRTCRTEGMKQVYVNAQQVEEAVLTRVKADLHSERFIKDLTARAKKAHQDTAALSDLDLKLKKLEAEINHVNANISKAMDLALKLADPAPAVQKVDELERQRKIHADEIARLKLEIAAQSALKSVTEDEVRQLLSDLLDRLEKASDRDMIRYILGIILEKIVLDPKTLECQLRYRLTVNEKRTEKDGQFEAAFDKATHAAYGGSIPLTRSI